MDNLLLFDPKKTIKEEKDSIYGTVELNSAILKLPEARVDEVIDFQLGILCRQLKRKWEKRRIKTEADDFKCSFCGSKIRQRR